MTGFYTAKGDQGFTRLLGKRKLSKDAMVFEVLGSLDELSAVLGIFRAMNVDEEIKTMILQVQRDLYGIMAEISDQLEKVFNITPLPVEKVTWLEGITDELGRRVQKPDGFIVPGDSLNGAWADMLRTVTRRVERRIVGFHQSGALENEVVIRYINRLSSFFFVLELLENQRAGVGQSTRAKEDLS